MEQLLALEMVRVTEAAAIASAAVHGPRHARRGGPGRHRGDAPRRWTRSTSPGTIVIGEGERDEAPMLYIGEQVGRHDGGRRRPSTSRWTRWRARTSSPRPGRGAHRARGVRGGRPDARPGHVHGEAGVGPVAAGCVDIRRPAAENLPPDRRGAGPEGLRHHGRHPGATAPCGPDRRGPRDRRPDQAHRRRRRVGGDQLRGPGHRRPRGDGHRRRARGRHHGGRAALPWRRAAGPVPLPERRGARARGPDDGHRGRDARLPDGGPGVGRQPGVRRDGRDRRATCCRACGSSAAGPGPIPW